ncbi:MAG: hypothetical protein ACFFCP_19750 [Promethearchaeota archaeon]
MRESDLEDAFAEVLAKFCDNPILIAEVQKCWDPNIPNSAGGLGAYITDPINIQKTTEWLMRIEGWWYLVWRTTTGKTDPPVEFKSEGAHLVSKFFYEVWLRKLKAPAVPADPYEDMSPAEVDAYLLANGTPGNPADPKVLIRKKFSEFLRTQPSWNKQSYAYVAAGDIGPWPKGGSGED